MSGLINKFEFSILNIYEITASLIGGMPYFKDFRGTKYVSIF